MYLPLLRHLEHSFSSVLKGHKGITAYEFVLSFIFLNFPYLVLLFFFLVEEPEVPWLPYEHSSTI